MVIVYSQCVVIHSVPNIIGDTNDNILENETDLSVLPNDSDIIV